MEADVIVHRFFEEAGAGYRSHAYFLAEALSEFQVCFTGLHELPAVHHDVVGALWHVVNEAYIVKTFEEKIALMSVVSQELIIVGIRGTEVL